MTTLSVTYSENSAIVTVTLPSGRGVYIDVYGPRDAFGTTLPATVNWSGIGSVSPADAVAYAEAIRAASLAADALDFQARQREAAEGLR